MLATHSFGVDASLRGDAGSRSRTGLVGKLSGFPKVIDLLMRLKSKKISNN